MSNLFSKFPSPFKLTVSKGPQCKEADVISFICDVSQHAPFRRQSIAGGGTLFYSLSLRRHSPALKISPEGEVN